MKRTHAVSLFFLLSALWGHPADVLAQTQDAQTLDRQLMHSSFVADEAQRIPLAGAWEKEDGKQAGSFCRFFRIPAEWKGQQIILRTDPVPSCFNLWVNGKFAGCCEDGSLPCEFDLTRFLKAGKVNRIAFQPFRRSDGAYAEDPAFFRFRDGCLYTRPAKHMEAIRITPELDADCRNGRLSVSLQVPDARRTRVELRLSDAEGNEACGPLLLEGPSVQGLLNIENPRKWSAEDPYLYRLDLRLTEGDRILQTLHFDVGFRRIELRGPDLLVNGERIRIKGIRHCGPGPDGDKDSVRGRMEQDIRLMKELHVNAVRHGCGPDDPYWHELCDRYGIYQIPETHPVWNSVSDRRLHSQDFELQYSYQDIWSAFKAPHQVELRNDHFFRDLSDCSLHWALLCDGAVKATGLVEDIHTAPQSRRLLSVPYGETDETAEWLLNLSYRLDRADGLLPAGSEIARQQLEIHIPDRAMAGLRSENRPKITHSAAHQFTVNGPDYEIDFSMDNGAVTRYRIGGTDLLRPGESIRPHYGPDSRRLSYYSLSQFDKNRLQVLTIEYRIDGTDAMVRMEYRINDRGAMEITETLVPGRQQDPAGMSRFGVQIPLSESFGNIEYYGRGPFGHDSDRNAAAFLGHWEQIRPQEAGSRTDIRWLRITDSQGRGLEIRAEEPFSAVTLPAKDGGAGLRLEGRNASRFHFILQPIQPDSQ